MSIIDGLREFTLLGCENDTITAMAYRIYEDIQRSKTYSELDKAYSADLETIYITAKQNGTTHIFLPLLSSHACNLYELEQTQSKLKELHKDSVLHLAICDTASHILYYSISNGFVDKPEYWQKKCVERTENDRVE